MEAIELNKVVRKWSKKGVVDGFQEVKKQGVGMTKGIRGFYP